MTEKPDLEAHPDGMRAWDGYVDVTPRRAEPDLEAARHLAFAAALDHGFHEIAIDEPFTAEIKYQQLGRDILAALGYPDDVTMWEPSDELLREWGIPRPAPSNVVSGASVSDPLTKGGMT